MVSAHGTNSSRHILFAENLQCSIGRKIYTGFLTRMKTLIDLSHDTFPALSTPVTGFQRLNLFPRACHACHNWLFLYLAFYAVCDRKHVVWSWKHYFYLKRTRNTSTWQLLLTIHEVKLGPRYRSDGFATNVRYFHRAISSVVQIRSSWTVPQWKGKISLSQLLLKYYWTSRESYEGYVI